MRYPSEQDKQAVLKAAQDRDEESLHTIISEIGLPDEVASRWYSYIVDYPDGVGNVQEINHLLNLSWI